MHTFFSLKTDLVVSRLIDLFEIELFCFYYHRGAPFDFRMVSMLVYIFKLNSCLHFVGGRIPSYYPDWKWHTHKDLGILAYSLSIPHTYMLVYIFLLIFDVKLKILAYSLLVRVSLAYDVM